MPKNWPIETKSTTVWGVLPGLHPIKNYPQSCPAGFYGGFPFIYDPGELNGLDVNSFDTALSAEGVYNVVARLSTDASYETLC